MEREHSYELGATCWCGETNATSSDLVIPHSGAVPSARPAEQGTATCSHVHASPPEGTQIFCVRCDREKYRPAFRVRESDEGYYLICHCGAWNTRDHINCYGCGQLLRDDGKHFMTASDHCRHCFQKYSQHDKENSLACPLRAAAVSAPPSGFCEKHAPSPARQYAGCWVCSREEETQSLAELKDAYKRTRLFSAKLRNALQAIVDSANNGNEPGQAWDSVAGGLIDDAEAVLKFESVSAPEPDAREQDEARKPHPFDKQPEPHIAHTNGWLEANQKQPQDVRWSLYPIGMVGRWIERAETAESLLQEREEQIAKAVPLFERVKETHQRQLSSGTGKITVCTCSWCNLANGWLAALRKE